MSRPEKTHPLFHWRKQNGVPLTLLAKRIPCSQSFLSQIEAYQKEPSLKTAARLSGETGLPLDAFVRETVQ